MSFSDGRFDCSSFGPPSPWWPPGYRLGGALAARGVGWAAVRVVADGGHVHEGGDRRPAEHDGRGCADECLAAACTTDRYGAAQVIERLRGGLQVLHGALEQAA